MSAAKPASRCLRSCGNIPERCSSFLRRRKKQTILFQDGQENQKVGVGKDKFLLTIYLNFVVRVTLHFFHTFLKSYGKLRKFTMKIELCEKQQPNNSMRSDTKIPNVLPGCDPDVPASNICRQWRQTYGPKVEAINKKTLHCFRFQVFSLAWSTAKAFSSRRKAGQFWANWATT